jgi:hypothetical protein
MKRPTPLFMLTLAGFILFAPKARAAELWFNAGGATYHDQPGRNGSSPGAGLELRLNEHWAVGLGKYINSHHKVSRYAGVIYTPFIVQTPVAPVYVGAQIGMVDGYPLNDGRPFMGGGLVAELRSERWAVAAVFMPASSTHKSSNALALQFKFRLGCL